MAQPKQLWRTTIVIWTDFDPSELEIDDLAREAMSGDGYCSDQNTETITNQSLFPGTEFFDSPEETDNSICDDCGATVESVIGCPDGAEICKSCFDAGKH